MRFRCDTRSKDELEAHCGKKAHDGLLNRYLGFSKEDWQRIIELFTYLRIHWNNPGHHYGQKRKMSCSSSIGPGPRPTRFKERSKIISEENSLKQADFITFFRQIQSHGGVADDIADSLLAVRNLDFDSSHITQLREAIRSRLGVYNAYMDRENEGDSKETDPWKPPAAEREMATDVGDAMHEPSGSNSLRPEKLAGIHQEIPESKQ
ncbi:uncharacterized protein E0L32_007506 [Thyridium curvatum]|uniref:Uncharacterized protein n=1 Tax=Thyridium curvatum TaxID=1093900 RepID=A0A507B393_9PEZI|nr:uncharacterized protein E0L32_007506 [Thyridium curvatum]TPX11769.1 hypothetical protein E0L32_007506 [Thyridium curvatum]